MSAPLLSDRLAALLGGLPVPGDLLREFAGLLARYGTLQGLREGRAFLWQEDPAERCALVLSGKILPVKRRFGASPLSLPPLLPGLWAALPETLAKAPSQADYLAGVSSELLVIPSRNLFVIASLPGAAPVLSRFLASEVLSLQGLLSGGGPRERILAWLLSRRRALGGIENDRVSATQGEIARELSLARETVNRHLSRLEGEGLIASGRGLIAVPDWAALEESLREE